MVRGQWRHWVPAIGADSRLARAPIRGRWRRHGYLPLTAENHRRKAEI